MPFGALVGSIQRKQKTSRKSIINIWPTLLVRTKWVSALLIFVLKQGTKFENFLLKWGIWFAHTDLLHFHSTVLCYLNRRKIPFVFPRSTAQLNKIHFRHLSFHGNKWKWLSTSSLCRFHKPISSMAPNLIINTLKKPYPRVYERFPFNSN